MLSNCILGAAFLYFTQISIHFSSFVWILDPAVFDANSLCQCHEDSAESYLQVIRIVIFLFSTHCLRMRCARFIGIDPTPLYFSAIHCKKKVGSSLDQKSGKKKFPDFILMLRIQQNKGKEIMKQCRNRCIVFRPVCSVWYKREIAVWCTRQVLHCSSMSVTAGAFGMIPPSRFS